MMFAEVIGDPIGHSRSPDIHNFWLLQLEIDADYRAHRVTEEELSAYFAARRADADWRGCNVTMPHKQAVLRHIDSLSPDAERVGAVNSIVVEDGALVGRNSDIAGFLEPLEAISGHDANRHAWVIGSGGAAAAILWALEGTGYDTTSVARDAQKAKAMRGRLGLDAKAVSLDHLKRMGDAPGLLVNASPLGMAGFPALDIDLSPLAADALVYDLVYQPLETKLLRAARARGLATIDGLAMLIGQAALAFEWLFDAAPPRYHDAELRRMLTS